MADILFTVSFGIIMAALLLSFFRLAKGPGLANRTVALDNMTIIVISVIVFIAHLTGRTIYLDVSMVYGLVSFVGVIAIARYLEGGL